MANRLPPAPANTALARFVRRTINTLPWVMVRHLRKARSDLERVRSLMLNLRNENYDLRMDYENLVRGHQIPRPGYLSLCIEQTEIDPMLILSVEYPRLRAAARFQRGGGDLRISASAAMALHQAAERVANEAARSHRDMLIRIALGGKTIGQIIREKLHG